MGHTYPIAVHNLAVAIAVAAAKSLGQVAAAAAAASKGQMPRAVVARALVVPMDFVAQVQGCMVRAAVVESVVGIPVSGCTADAAAAVVVVVGDANRRSRWTRGLLKSPS